MDPFREAIDNLNTSDDLGERVFGIKSRQAAKARAEAEEAVKARMAAEYEAAVVAELKKEEQP